MRPGLLGVNPLIMVARKAVVCSRLLRRLPVLASRVNQNWIPEVKLLPASCPQCVRLCLYLCQCLCGVDRNRVDCVRAGGTVQGVFRGELRGQPVATRFYMYMMRLEVRVSSECY